MNILDIIGPIMIGPSSSHTAGAVRLAHLAKHIFQEPIVRAELYLHGSFADTYKGHGTDLALVAGLLGFHPDDERIPNAFELASAAHLEFSIHTIDLGSFTHPNSVKFVLYSDTNKCEVTGCSLGGGRVSISQIDGFSVDFDGGSPTLLTQHYDKPGIIANVTKILADNCINVGQMKVFRQSRGGIAAMIIQMDQPIADDLLAKVAAIPHIQKVRNICSI